MATAEQNEYAGVVQIVGNWPAELKIELANDLLRSCRGELGKNATRGISAAEAARLFGGAHVADGEMESRDEDRLALEAALLEKYLK